MVRTHLSERVGRPTDRTIVFETINEGATPSRLTMVTRVTKLDGIIMVMSSAVNRNYGGSIPSCPAMVLKKPECDVSLVAEHPIVYRTTGVRFSHVAQ